MGEEAAKLTAIFEAQTDRLDAALAKADAGLEATAAVAAESSASVTASVGAMGAAADAAVPSITRLVAVEGTAAETAAAFAVAQAKWTEEAVNMAPAGFAAANATNFLAKSLEEVAEVSSTKVPAGFQAVAGSLLTVEQQYAAVASLQKQRSAALLSGMAAEEKAAARAASELEKHSGQAMAAANALGVLRGAMSEVAEVSKKISPEVAETLEKTAANAGVLTTALELLTSPIGLIVAGLAGVAAVGVGSAYALLEMAESSSEAGDKLYVMSEKTGVSVEGLHALEIGAELSHTSLERVIMSITMLQAKMSKTESSTSSLSKELKGLHLNSEDANIALRQMFEHLSKFPAGMQRTQEAMKFMGARMGRDFGVLVTEMGGDIETFEAKLKSLGIEMTEGEAKAAHEFNKQLILLDAQWETLKRQIEETATPIVSEWLKEISSWLVTNHDRAKEWGQDFVKELGDITEAFRSSGLLDNLKEDVVWLDKNKESILAVASAVGTLLTSAIELINFINKFNPAVWEIRILANVVGEGAKFLFDSVPKLFGQEKHGNTYAGGQSSKTGKGYSTYNWETGQYETAGGRYEDEGEYAIGQSYDAPAMKAPPRGGGGTKKKGGSGKSEKENATKAALESAQVQLKVAEDLYQDLLTTEQSYYDQSLTDLNSYSEAKFKAETDRYNKELEVFKKEQATIDTGTFKSANAKQLAIDKLNEKQLQSKLKHNQTLKQIDDESYKIQMAADKQHAANLIALQESAFKTLEAKTDREAVLSPVEAENQRFDNEAAIYKAKIKELVDETNRIISRAQGAGRDPDFNKLQELGDGISAIEAQVAASAEAHTGKTIAARLKELEATRSYAQELNSILQRTEDIEAETTQSRIEEITKYARSAMEAATVREQFEVKQEQRSAERILQDLRDQKFYIEQQRELGLIRDHDAVRQLEAITKQIQAVEENSAQKIVDIHQRAQDEIYKHYGELASDIANIISSGFQSGFKGILSSVQHLLQQISFEILQSGLLHAFSPTAPNQSQAGGIVGGLANAFLNKFSLLAKSTTTVTGGTGTTRPRTVGGTAGVTHQDVTNASQSVTSAIHEQTRLIADNADFNTQEIMAGQQSSADKIIAGLRPQQQSFLNGLIGAALSGAVSGITSGLVKDITGPKLANEGPAQARPKTAPVLRTPGKASGGGFGPNEMFRVFEKGPEPILFTGDHSGYVVPNDVAYPKNKDAAGGGGGKKEVNVTINVNDRRGGRSHQPSKSEREIAEQAAAAIQRHLG